MSSKKPSSEPDDLFHSIPPQEQFHAFPALDAFPREAIAFLTGNAPSGTRRPTEPNRASEISGPRPASPPRPDTRPVTKPLATPDTTPIERAHSHTGDRKEDLSAGQKQSLSTDHTIDHSQSQTQDSTQDHTQDVTKDHSPSRTQDHTSDRTLSAEFGYTPLDRLNANQRRVLCHLLRVKPEIIKMAHIARAVNLGENTTRTIMRRLAALDFLTFKKARDGNIQGVRIAFNHPRCAPFEAADVIDQTQNQTLNLSLGHTTGHTINQSTYNTINQSFAQPVTPPYQRPDTRPAPQTPSRIDRKDSFYPGGEDQESDTCLDGWTDDLLATMWPKVFEAGFRLEHLRRVLAARVKIGKTLDRDMLAVSLDRADWELERFGRLTELANGEKVKNPQAYLFTALARWGALRPHPDYVSREEVEAEAAAREIERRRKAAKLVEEALFASWREALDPAELEDLLRGCPGGPKDVWLKNHWRTHVRPAKDAGA
ncbi:MAG: hypothetical protein GYA47_11735 [Desulfovibrio sp.]|nr:hypothetical protein [Desulfovibrio sp.]